MSKVKLVTHTLNPEDMAKFAKVARVKRLNSSSLLRVLIHEFLKKEGVAARREYFQLRRAS